MIFRHTQEHVDAFDRCIKLLRGNERIANAFWVHFLT